MLRRIKLCSVFVLGLAAVTPAQASEDWLSFLFPWLTESHQGNSNPVQANGDSTITVMGAGGGGGHPPGVDPQASSTTGPIMSTTGAGGGGGNPPGVDPN